jgi:EF hand
LGKGEPIAGNREVDMVKLVAAGVLLLVALMQSARADDGPAALAQVMQDDPERFLTVAQDVIAGFGGPTGLTPSGIEEHVALERAAARAGAMRKLLAMDLDNDGSVDGAELGVALRAAKASARGRLERQFTAADLNADLRIDAAELRREGQAAALRSLTEAEAAALRALMTLDQDGDGALRLEEVQAALRKLDQAT